ncbi:MAG: acyl carrier protein [Gammaproteobacteria bacterium]|nr:acyl carrier protein [Gammaproteobacteria bacterium]
MNDSREHQRQALLGFLRSIQKAGRPVTDLTDSDSLVASGLIDSLAILQIVTWLETTCGIDFAVRGVAPEELATIGGILGVIDQESGRSPA